MKKKENLLLKKALLLSTLLLAGCSSKNNQEVANISINEEVLEEDYTLKTDIDNLSNIIIEPEEIEIEEVSENEHIDILMIGDMLIHKPVYKSGIQDDGSLNYDHFFSNIQGK